jgi:hypothetical protein
VPHGRSGPCGEAKSHASFEAFTAVMFQVEVFWYVTPCSVVVGFLPEDGSSRDSETLVCYHSTTRGHNPACFHGYVGMCYIN